MQSLLLGCLVILHQLRFWFFKQGHDAIFLRDVVDINEGAVVLHDYVIAVAGVTEIVWNSLFRVVRGAKHIVHEIKLT